MLILNESPGATRDSDDLFTASLDLGIGRNETKNQQNRQSRVHANEKHCVHDFKMAGLLIRKESKTAHRSKGSIQDQGR